MEDLSHEHDKEMNNEKESTKEHQGARSNEGNKHMEQIAFN